MRGADAEREHGNFPFFHSAFPDPSSIGSNLATKSSRIQRLSTENPERCHDTEHKKQRWLESTSPENSIENKPSEILNRNNQKRHQHREWLSWLQRTKQQSSAEEVTNHETTPDKV